MAADNFVMRLFSISFIARNAVIPSHKTARMPKPRLSLVAGISKLAARRTIVEHMAKRRLNKQQTRRIHEQAQARRDNAEQSDLKQGLVVAHYGSEVDIDSDGERVRCHMRANLPTIVCGDQILWQAGEEGLGVIDTLMERQSLLLRPRPYADPKPVCANIDTIYVVFAPQPEPHETLIDRYLVAAENAGIRTEIIINKCDLINSDNSEQIDALDKLYSGLGYHVYRTSKADQGLDALRAALSGHRSIFVGQSGVGKSSLINILLGEEIAATGELSSANDKGKHTTTTSVLYSLPSGGAIIDSPGIREFGLWHLDKEAIIRGFREFAPYVTACRFRDCAHENDKGCALLAAEQDGFISPSRMASYRHILHSLDERS